jgi:alpha-L-arabinofuranosidase
MKATIILMTILIACVNIGRAEKAQTTISVNQTTTHHSYQSQSSPSIVLNGDEINAINTKDENHKPPAKSKPKRQIGLKIFGGVVVAYGLLVVLSEIFGPLFPYK